jgi:hypothetical protein
MIKKIETISKLFYYSLLCKYNPHIVPTYTYIEDGELLEIMIYLDPVDYWKYYLINYKKFKDEESVIAGW